MTDLNVPYGTRTRVTAVKGRCPRPLDDRVWKSPPISELRHFGARPFGAAKLESGPESPAFAKRYGVAGANLTRIRKGLPTKHTKRYERGNRRRLKSREVFFCEASLRSNREANCFPYKLSPFSRHFAGFADSEFLYLFRVFLCVSCRLFRLGQV